MLMASAAMMATAWLGHLRFEDEWTFWTALAVSWLVRQALAAFHPRAA